MMISIELTQEHKDKLLEMCNSLWKKEQWNFSLDVPEGFNSNHVFIIGFIGTNDYIPNCDCYIHWFEFCMTHLSHAIIFNPKNSLRACNHNHAGLLESVMHLFYNEKQAIHPVDYLYDEFKKLKLKNYFIELE